MTFTQCLRHIVTRVSSAGAVIGIAGLASASLISEAVAETVLRVVPHADLQYLDPIWTTASISRNHGYLIYDTLYAMDENFEPQPQMVDSHSVSDDRLTWTFVLRDGLTWHDGKDVTAEDCVASLRRWGKRDWAGRALFEVISSIEATDAKTITITLSSPYGLVLESIGKISSNVAFMMPKHIAQTSPFEPIQEHTGSGPFKFVGAEWVPGFKVVYVRNTDYLPRSEPPSIAAGGKVAKVDRIEWIHFPDPGNAVKALINGEVDYLESPANDLLELLANADGVTTQVNDRLGNIGLARFNHLLPPFDNVEVRRAAIMAMKQEDYMASGIGDEAYWKTCYSVFPCGTPMENMKGSSLMQDAGIDRAKAALAAANYDGTPVVLMQPTDVPALSAFSLISAEKLRQIGMEVDVQAMDWSTLVYRRAKRNAAADGGWNMFHTWWSAVDIIDPSSIAFSGDADSGWFGWPDDDTLEEARSDYAQAQTRKDKKAAASQVQERLWTIGASGHLGQFFAPVAYRSNVNGLIESPVQFFWNLSVDE